jgi:hypothetical protein
MNQRKKLVFHSIPFAGGSRIYEALAAPGNGAIRSIHASEVRQVGLHHAGADVNFSHHAFADLRGEEASVFYATWLRDPVEMALEAFIRIRAQPEAVWTSIRDGLLPDPTLCIQFRRILEADTLESYSIEAWNDGFPVYPAGRFTLDFRRFAFVGFWETMGESLAELSRLSGYAVRPIEIPRVRESTEPRGTRLRLAQLLGREREIYDLQFARRV